LLSGKRSAAAASRQVQAAIPSASSRADADVVGDSGDDHFHPDILLMPASPPAQSTSDNPNTKSCQSPILGTSTPFTLNNLSGAARPGSQNKQERQLLHTEGGDNAPQMIATLPSSSQSVLRDSGHRPTQSVPLSPSSPTFRHSATSSVSQLPLTPESSRYRPKYGNRMSDTAHKVTTPLLENDENEPPVSRPRKQSGTYPMRDREERDPEQKEVFPSIPSTFPLSSPPASPPLPKRKLRPSLEGVFDTPTPKPRNSVVLTPPPTEPSRAISRVPKERRLPRGENPFIFGKASLRRSVRTPPEADINQPNTIDITSALEAPAVNITSPTPIPSPSKTSPTFAPEIPPVPSFSSIGNLKLPGSEHSHAPKTVTYEDEVLAGSSSVRSKSRDGHDEDDAGGSRRISHTASSSNPPSAFATSRRNSKSTKGPHGGQVSPSHTAPSSPTEPLTKVPSIPPERPRTTTPRPGSRVASTRARSTFLDANSSRTSIPLSAIMNPRPPSVARTHYDFIRRDEGLYMRDPHREPVRVGWKVRVRGKRLEQVQDQETGTLQVAQLQSPTSGLLFYPGFLFPPLWWIGALLQGEQIRCAGGFQV